MFSDQTFGGICTHQQLRCLVLANLFPPKSDFQGRVWHKPLFQFDVAGERTCPSIPRVGKKFGTRPNFLVFCWKHSMNYFFIDYLVFYLQFVGWICEQSLRHNKLFHIPLHKGSLASYQTCSDQTFGGMKKVCSLVGNTPFFLFFASNIDCKA